MLKRIVLLSLIVLLTQPLLNAQQNQYKRLGLNTMVDISDGKYDSALKKCQDILERYPNDLEALYCLAIIHTQKNNISTAMIYANQAIEHGLPIERFIAGPRELLSPLINSEEWVLQNARKSPDLLHGPMLGNITPTGVDIWLRTAEESAVVITYSQSSTMDNSRTSAIMETSADKDYTVTIPLQKLRPQQKYFYTITIDGVKVNQQFSFTTSPPYNSTAKFQVGFGGGAGYTPQYEHMWNTINSHPLHAFLFLGDNVYIDNPTRPLVQKYCYYRRQSRPEYKQFIASTPLYAIWDDHDFVDNDQWGGPEIDTPSWKRPVWEIYKQNWVNPSYGGGENQPGCWFSFSIADVDFIMLDGRYYREDPKTENPSMLGPAQKEWLFKTLKESTGTFKILASPVPWSEGAKPGSRDPWQGYLKERNEILSFIHENNIAGVVLISADRHRSDAWKIEHPDGYTFYEFESSRLTNIHYHRIMPMSLFGYNKKCSFGKLIFDTTLDDPSLSYEIFNIDNNLIHKITIYKSQLQNN